MRPSPQLPARLTHLRWVSAAGLLALLVAAPARSAATAGAARSRVLTTSTASSG